MEEFQLSRFVKEGSDLLRNVTEEFNRLGIDTSKLPKIFPDDSGKIKLVFIGQYSAGKSSIIKMLTGEDIEIGAKITTQNSQPYPWNGLEIIDTPGIHTELRPDHDEITYDQINHAALLVFVITNEGFSQRMGDHFRHLAIDQKRGSNMVLVVNKMDRTALGNVPEQQKIIRDDLQKVIDPFTPDKLYLSFIDTTSFFDSLEESDPQFKQDLFNDSGHDQFVENLNRFVADKGILQKINLPLNIIASEIRSKIQGDSVEIDIQASIEIGKNRRKILLNSKKEFMDDVDQILEKLKLEINRLGKDTADSIIGRDEITSEIYTSKINDALDRINNLIDEYSQKIGDNLQIICEQSDIEIQKYNQSSYVQKVNSNLQSQLNSSSSSGGNIAISSGIAVIGATVASQAGQIATNYMAANSIQVTTALGNAVANLAGTGAVAAATSNGLGAYSAGIGAVVREGVKKLPFLQETLSTLSPGMQRFASFFASGGGRLVGGVLMGLGAIYTVYSMYRDNQKAKEAEAKINSLRNEIIFNFQKIADQSASRIRNDFRNLLIDKTFDPEIEKINLQINQTEKSISDSKIKNEKLTQMLSRVENLIGEIQRAQS